MNYAQLLFPDFSLILCGYLVCRFTKLNRTVWEQVESLVYYFLFPVLLFTSIVRSPLDVHATSNLILAGITVCASGIALSYLIPHLPFVGKHVDKRDHAGAAQIAFRFNSFIALAIAERLAGPTGVQLIAVLIGFGVPLCNVGAVWPMARHANKGFLGELVKNPLIVATVVGLVSNLAGFSLPIWLEPTLNRIGAASIALGLLAAGAGLQFGSLANSKAVTIGVLSIRHFFLPIVAALVAHALKLSAMHTTILLAFSALPTASSAYVLAAKMGYNGPYVAGLVTLSTLLGMASLTFALGVLR